MADRWWWGRGALGVGGQVVGDRVWGDRWWGDRWSVKGFNRNNTLISLKSTVSKQGQVSLLTLSSKYIFLPFNFIFIY